MLSARSISCARACTDREFGAHLCGAQHVREAVVALLRRVRRLSLQQGAQGVVIVHEELYDLQRG